MAPGWVHVPVRRIAEKIVFKSHYHISVKK